MALASSWARILVPLDGSAIANRAVPFAQHLSRVAGAELILFQVADRDDDARETLDSTGAALKQRGVEARVVLAQGHPGSAIASIAHDTRTDVIVMSTHGRNGLGRTVLGSVAEEVLRRVSQPVVLIGPHCGAAWAKAPLGPVVVGLDASKVAARGIIPAKQLALTLGTWMALVRVIEPTQEPLSTEAVIAPAFYGMAPYALAAAPSPANVEKLLRQARPYVQQVADDLSPDLLVTAETEVGDAATVLCDVATEQRAVAIALASHGRAGLDRLVFGSVTSAVVRKSTAPVLVTGAAQG